MFTLKDPKRVKMTVKLSSFFAFLGSMCVKAARKMMMKSASGLPIKISTSKTQPRKRMRKLDVATRKHKVVQQT